MTYDAYNPTVEAEIRRRIGWSGPQLPELEYEARIDTILNEMSNVELLSRISYAIAMMKEVGQ